MPPTPPGLVPYAGPAIQDPYGETLLQMMQQQSERQYEHAMREAQRSADKWGAGADFIGSLYPAYLQQQELQRAEEDRQRAIEDRKRLYEATVRQEELILGQAARDEAKYEAQELGKQSREAQADLAIGRLASTPFVPRIEEGGAAATEPVATAFGDELVVPSGQVSVQAGEALPAIAPMREDITRLPDGGFAIEIPSALPGGKARLHRLTNKEETERLSETQLIDLAIKRLELKQAQETATETVNVFADIGGKRLPVIAQTEDGKITGFVRGPNDELLYHEEAAAPEIEHVDHYDDATGIMRRTWFEVGGGGVTPLGSAPAQPAPEGGDGGGEMTAQQAAAMGFANAMSQAEGVIQSFMPYVKDQSAAEFGWQKLLDMAPGLQSDEHRGFMQGVTAFVHAILRDQSGAAITSEDMKIAFDSWIPHPADDDTVLENKRRARNLQIQNLIDEASGRSAFRGVQVYKSPEERTRALKVLATEQPSAFHVSKDPDYANPVDGPSPIP